MEEHKNTTSTKAKRDFGPTVRSLSRHATASSHAYWRTADRPAVWQDDDALAAEFRLVAGIAASRALCAELKVDSDLLYQDGARDVLVAVLKLHRSGQLVTANALHAELARMSALGDPWESTERAAQSVLYYLHHEPVSAAETRTIAHRVRWLAWLREEWKRADVRAALAWTGRLNNDRRSQTADRSDDGIPKTVK
jgi:hypothetical protein